MPAVQSFAPGGYRFITHAFQYSGGVAAEPGFRIERARFASPPKLADGFDAIEAHLSRLGRPPTAFCACELRSPAQFTEAGFVAFNRHYVAAAGDVGHLPRRGQPGGALECLPRDRPAGRAGVLRLQLHGAERATATRPRALSAPAAARRARAAPATPSASSGSATSRPTACARRRASSSARWSGAWRRSASAGPTSPRRRSIRSSTSTRFSPTRSSAAARRAAGLTWHYARPPVQGLDYEMDVRGLARELVI